MVEISDDVMFWMLLSHALVACLTIMIGLISVHRKSLLFVYIQSLLFVFRNSMDYTSICDEADVLSHMHLLLAWL